MCHGDNRQAGRHILASILEAMANRRPYTNRLNNTGLNADQETLLPSMSNNSALNRSLRGKPRKVWVCLPKALLRRRRLLIEIDIRHRLAVGHWLHYRIRLY